MMIVDRIENGVAIIECNDGSMREIPLFQLPDGVHEGSVLVQIETGFALDTKEEHKRRENASDRTHSLFK